MRDFDSVGERIITPFTFLSVKTDGGRFLVDTGAGDLYETAGKLPLSLQDAGISPQEIDTVIITHAHPDHIGGALDRSGDFLYPNARYVIRAEEWEFWFSREAESTAPGPFVEVARDRLSALESRTTLAADGDVISPGVSLLAAPGHTPGHTAVMFTSNSETLVYAADTALSPLHLRHPEWPVGLDIDTRTASVTRKRLADRAASEGWLVILQHFPPFPGLGRIRRNGEGWRWEPNT
jgi:glyoxylase-like metal-dependent hydrolase (beta-lactamase superfamily II)